MAVVWIGYEQRNLRGSGHGFFVYLRPPTHEDPCDVAGRGGLCQRLIGHPEEPDNVFPRGTHVSWDTDNYVAWPVREVALEGMRL